MKYPFFKSVKGKFFTITFILILITGIGATTASYISYTNKLHSNSVHMAESNLQFLSENLNSAISDIAKFAHFCQTTPEIVRFVMTEREDEGYASIAAKAKSRLDEELQYNPSEFYIQRTVVANLSQDNYLQCVITALSTDKPIVGIIKEQPYFEEALASNRTDLGLGLWPNPFFPAKPDIIPVILPIFHTYKIDTIGFVYIEVSQDLLLDTFSEYTQNEGLPVYVTLGEHTYKIMGSEITALAEGYTIRKASQRTSSYAQAVSATLEGNGEETEMVAHPLETSGCYISQPIPTDMFRQEFSSYLIQVFSIILLILVVGIALYLFLIRTVNRPVTALNRRLGKIASGDFSVDKSIEWENEFGDIGHSINVLAGDISDLMEHRIAYEKEKKDYEYKMLQSQINPHFLYNTLNSIKWMAVTQGAQGIGEMVTSLSRLLKSIAKGTSTIVSIQDELNLLDDYFLIQKYRYGGSISLEKDVEAPELVKNQIPRFTLQPIVENSIFHGIEPKGTDGVIKIHIYQDKENADVCIDITDNGIGMDEETIRTLLQENNNAKSSFFKDVGVSSVHKRLQYCFGENYGLKISSVPGEYTLVTIRLKNIPVQPC